jgi:hypothetical protein
MHRRNAEKESAISNKSYWRLAPMTKSILATLTAVVLLAGVAACEQEGPAERAGERVDEAVDDTGDAIEKAGEKAGDKMEDATK